MSFYTMRAYGIPNRYGNTNADKETTKSKSETKEKIANKAKKDKKTEQSALINQDIEIKKIAKMKAEKTKYQNTLKNNVNEAQLEIMKENISTKFNTFG